MIENILILLFLGFVNPADPSGKTMYPSGVKDSDNVYFDFPPPASKNADLVLPAPIYDGKKYILLPGIYEITLSEDNKQLILTQSEEVRAKLPITQSINIEQERKVPAATAKVINPKEVLVIYKNGNVELQSILPIP